MSEELVPSWISRYIVGESPTGSARTNAIRDAGFAAGMIPLIGGAADVTGQRIADYYDKKAGRQVYPRSNALDAAQVASGLIPIVIRKPMGMLTSALMHMVGNDAQKAGEHIVLRNPLAVKRALSKANSLAQPKGSGAQLFIAKAEPVDNSASEVAKYTFGATPSVKDTYQFRGPMQGKDEWSKAGGAFGEIKLTGKTKRSNGGTLAQGTDGKWYAISKNAEGETRPVLTVSGEDAANALDKSVGTEFDGTITSGSKSNKVSNGTSKSTNAKGNTTTRASAGNSETSKTEGTTINKANLAAQALSRSAPSAVSDWARRNAINEIGGLSANQLAGMTAAQAATDAGANYLKERQAEADLSNSKVGVPDKYDWPDNYHNYVEQLLAGFRRNPRDYEIDNDIANVIQQYLSSKEWTVKHLKEGKQFPDFNEVFK